MAIVDVADLAVAGDPAIPPEPVVVVDVATLGVVATPWAEQPDLPARVDVAELSVSGTPWTVAAFVDVAEVLVSGTPWAPSITEAAVYLLDLDGVWQPAQMIPL